MVPRVGATTGADFDQYEEEVLIVTLPPIYGKLEKRVWS